MTARYPAQALIPPCGMLDVLAAVNLDAFAGDMLGLVRSQEGDQVGQIVGFADPLEDDLGHRHIDDLVAGLGFLQHRGLDQPRRDGVDRHPEGPQFLGHRLSVADDPGLGGAVVGLAELAAQAVDRGDVDDPARFLLLEQRGGVAGEIEVALEVDLEDPVPLLLGHLPADPVPVHPGVVDKDIDAAEGRKRRLDYRLGLGEGGDVAFDADRLAAHGLDLLDDRFCLFLVAAVGQADVGAFLGHHQGDGGADPLGATGDDGIFPFQ